MSAPTQGTDKAPSSSWTSWFSNIKVPGFSGKTEVSASTLQQAQASAKEATAAAKKCESLLNSATEKPPAQVGGGRKKKTKSVQKKQKKRKTGRKRTVGWFGL